MPPDEESAATVLAAIEVRWLASGLVDIGVSLSRLAAQCVERDYPKSLYSFYLLHHAYRDLQVDEHTFYWDGVTRDNIESVIVSQALDWIKEHDGCI